MRFLAGGCRLFYLPHLRQQSGRTILTINSDQLVIQRPQVIAAPQAVVTNAPLLGSVSAGVPVYQYGEANGLPHRGRVSSDHAAGVYEVGDEVIEQPVVDDVRQSHPLSLADKHDGKQNAQDIATSVSGTWPPSPPSIANSFSFLLKLFYLLFPYHFYRCTARLGG